MQRDVHMRCGAGRGVLGKRAGWCDWPPIPPPAEPDPDPPNKPTHAALAGRRMLAPVSPVTRGKQNGKQAKVHPGIGWPGQPTQLPSQDVTRLRNLDQARRSNWRSARLAVLAPQWGAPRLGWPHLGGRVPEAHGRVLAVGVHQQAAQLPKHPQTGGGAVQKHPAAQPAGRGLADLRRKGCTRGAGLVDETAERETVNRAERSRCPNNLSWLDTGMRGLRRCG
jgi:hypothetical protein